MPRRQTRRQAGFATTRGGRYPRHPISPLHYALARSFARSNLFHPRLFPWPSALQVYANDFNGTELEIIRGLVTGLINQEERVLQLYHRFEGTGTNTTINIAGRCNRRFYSTGRACVCRDVSDCVNVWGEGEGIPLVRIGDELAPFYDPELRASYENWDRTGVFEPPPNFVPARGPLYPDR